MARLRPKSVLVLGLGVSGVAAAELLARLETKVVGVDSADTEALRRDAERLRGKGIAVSLGAETAPAGEFDLVVASPGVPWANPILKEMVTRNIPIIGEFELGWQHSLCLNIAVTGTNGKTTTTELIERLLTHHHIKTLAAGNIGRPVCAVAEQTRELDFLTLEASSFQFNRRAAQHHPRPFGPLCEPGGLRPGEGEAVS
jgi:UDP-N-acetylmuramoylalanine--D-glutamate ligase